MVAGGLKHWPGLMSNTETADLALPLPSTPHALVTTATASSAATRPAVERLFAQALIAALAPLLAAAAMLTRAPRSALSNAPATPFCKPAFHAEATVGWAIRRWRRAKPAATPQIPLAQVPDARAPENSTSVTKPPVDYA